MGSEPEFSNADLLTHYLASLPYPERRKKIQGSANDIPRFFYKYLGPNIKCEWLRDLLIDSKLFLKSPSDFNDPFDMKGQVLDEPNVDKKREYLKALYKRQVPLLNWKQRQVEVNKMMCSLSTHEKLKQSFIKTIEDYGISCFSTEPRSILMWSHYGQHHKGVALQFDYARDISCFQYLLPIKYRKDYPTIEYYADHSRYEDVIQGKYEDWKYEKEWRLIKAEQRNTYHSFDKSALTGVILGCRVEQITEDRIRALLEERETMGHGEIKLYKASLHESKYKMVIRRA